MNMTLKDKAMVGCLVDQAVALLVSDTVEYDECDTGDSRDSRDYDWLTYMDEEDIEDDYIGAETISELRSVLKKAVEWIAQN